MPGRCILESICIPTSSPAVEIIRKQGNRPFNVCGVRILTRFVKQLIAFLQQASVARNLSRPKNAKPTTEWYGILTA